MSKRAITATMLALFGIVIALFMFSRPTRFDPNEIDSHWIGLPLPPCFVDAKACVGHALGTDELGRDILARLFVGGQVTLGLSIFAVLLEFAFGISFGVLARYGGAVSKFVAIRIGDAVACFPGLPFIMVVVILSTPTNKATLSAVVLASLAGLLMSSQIIRPIAVTEDVRAIVPALIDQAARDLARAMVLLSTVDFFGIGIQPPTASWGNMLSDTQETITISWWATVLPAACLFGALLAIEFLRRRFLDTSVIVKYS